MRRIAVCVFERWGVRLWVREGCKCRYVIKMSLYPAIKTLKGSAFSKTSIGGSATEDHWGVKGVWWLCNSEASDWFWSLTGQFSLRKIRLLLFGLLSLPGYWSQKSVNILSPAWLINFWCPLERDPLSLVLLRAICPPLPVEVREFQALFLDASCQIEQKALSKF